MLLADLGIFRIQSLFIINCFVRHMIIISTYVVAADFFFDFGSLVGTFFMNVDYWCRLPATGIRYTF